MQNKSTQIKEEICEALSKYYGLSPSEANEKQLYVSCVSTVKSKLALMRAEYHREIKRKSPKKLYFMCMEFLVGPQLRNNVYNLGLLEEYREALDSIGISFDKLCEIDPDPGLGNGGLGRLAACYMDSLTVGAYPATGFSICYEYGLFKQKIIDGLQIELPDPWLDDGEAWLSQRSDKSYTVKFGGNIREEWHYDKLSIIHENYEQVEAVPYDMFVSGKNSKAVNVLRLWKARDTSRFNMKLFSQGQYAKSVEESSNAEAISKVLYPSDNHNEGKLLRFSQQYFLCSASLQSIISDHLADYGNLDAFPDKVAIHLNDTHPALCIPELMRILMDTYSYSWDSAWDIVRKTFSYTNHTIMPEALEVWSEELFKLRLPRIYMIVNEINNRLCADLWKMYPGDWERISNISLINHKQVRMANLSVIGSHSVNGVSKLHSEILKTKVFRDLYKYEPYKFCNVTNGISFSRWLCQSNPDLYNLIRDLTGEKFSDENLVLLKEYADDTEVRDRLARIKLNNKKKLCSEIKKAGGIVLNPYSVFDVQIKRFHEYKRQLLNVLQILRQYDRIKSGDTDGMIPQTYLFAGKAAQSYYLAKDIISLIIHLAREIEYDKKAKEFIQVVFIEDYCVSSAEKVIPAAEISEQISLAGKEASGTGNMKLMLNGALTVGTNDGANIEIADAVGKDNIFLFGFESNEVEQIWRSGYNALDIYSKNPTLQRCIDMLSRGFCGTAFDGMRNYLLGAGRIADPYMCFADFDSYCQIHDKALNVYRDNCLWNKMSLINIASAAIFSSDRSIKEYSEKIWNLDKVYESESND